MKNDETYRRRFLFYVLLAALLSIWARVIFAVYEQVDIQARLDVVARPERREIPNRERYNIPGRIPYQADFKDPFVPADALSSRSETLSSGVAQDLKAETHEIPDLTLQGVTGTTAMLLDDRDMIHFVRAGDTVDVATILQVGHDSVLAKFAKTTFTLQLDP